MNLLEQNKQKLKCKLTYEEKEKISFHDLLIRRITDKIKIDTFRTTDNTIHYNSNHPM